MPPGLLAAALLLLAGGARSAEPPDALAWLRHARVLSPHRDVVQARLVCSLIIEGRRYPVVDLVEHVRSSGPPRGVLRAIVLTPAHGLANELPYWPPASPLSCDANVLTFSDPVEVANTLPEGRRVAFDNQGADMRVLDGS
jgi:hypothetical protein